MTTRRASLSVARYCFYPRGSFRLKRKLNITKTENTMVGRRSSVVSKQEEGSSAESMVALLPQESLESSPKSIPRLTNSQSSSPLVGSHSYASDSDTVSSSRSISPSERRWNSGPTTKSKEHAGFLKRVFLFLRLKIGNMGVTQCLLTASVALLVIPYAVHRLIVWKKGNSVWVFSPIMHMKRPCPVPSYPTLDDSFAAGNDLKICLTTLTDQKTQRKASSFLRRTIRWRNYDNILDLTWDSKTKYAEKHGYHLFDGSALVDVSRPAQWSKILAVQHLLAEEDCDWVLWHDADTLFMNTTVRIQDFLPSSPDVDLLVTVDLPNPGYNSGSWLIKNSEWGRKFLQDWWDMKSFVRLPGQSLSGDNDAFKALLKSYSQEEFDKHIGVPSRCTMNSFAKFLRPSEKDQMTEETLKNKPWYMSENFYHSGDFLVHVPGYDNKIGTLEMLMDEIQ